MKSDLAARVTPFAVYVWDFSTTTEGKVVTAGILFSASLSFASLDAPVHMLLFGLSFLAVTSYLVGLVFRPVVRMRGVLPDRIVAGETALARVTLTNVGKRSIYDVSLGYFGLPEGIEKGTDADVVSEIAPGDSCDFIFQLRPLRRGVYTLPRLRVYSTFPLNLLRTPARHVGVDTFGLKHALLVLPSFHPIDAINVPVSERYQPGGIALSSHIGESPEYIGNREYRPGDSLRHIDFRSWGRLARPVVREYQEEYYCRIALILDTFVGTESTANRGAFARELNAAIDTLVPSRRRIRAHGVPSLEVAVSLTASIADALARGEYIIDIFAAGPALHVFRAGRNVAHFENVLELLSGVGPCKTNPFGEITPAIEDELATISTVVCVFLGWDAARERLVRSAIDSGCSLKLILVRNHSRPDADLDVPTGIEFVELEADAIRAGGVDSL